MSAYDPFLTLAGVDRGNPEQRFPDNLPIPNEVLAKLKRANGYRWVG